MDVEVNNEWNQCESGVCRDYTVYKKTSIWFVAPADGGYSPMRPADENTENNMEVCTIDGNTHACKGPGGKADAYCHAGDIKGTAESAEKAQCEAITSATSLTGASKTLEIIGGEPSKSYTLVGWYPSADACMNSMANDISFDKWTYFAYGWGNKCNSNGDCKCYAFWDTTNSADGTPPGEVGDVGGGLVSLSASDFYFYGSCTFADQSSYTDSRTCASNGAYDTYRLNRNRAPCEYSLGTCRQGEGCGDEKGCLNSECVLFKKVYDTGTKGHCKVSSYGKLCAGKMGEVCLENSDCASNNCGFIAGKKVCLGDYGDPCEADSQCGQFQRCKGNICCRDCTKPTQQSHKVNTYSSVCLALVTQVSVNPVLNSYLGLVVNV